MKTTYPTTETTVLNPHHHLLCWKSVFAGLMIATMGMLILGALGAAIGGYTAESLVSAEEGATALASGAGLFLGFSILASLFCGAYFAVRISRFRTTRVGAAHGMVIASLFFALFVFGLGKAAKNVSQGLSKISQGLAGGAANLAENPMLQDIVHKAIGTSNLKSDPSQVTAGLIARLSAGDTESAKDYLAYQTGQSRDEVDAKVTQMKTDFEAKAKVVGEKVAHEVGDSGVALFLLFFVGLVSATVGGRVASRMNVESPFASA